MIKSYTTNCVYDLLVSLYLEDNRENYEEETKPVSYARSSLLTSVLKQDSGLSTLNILAHAVYSLESC